MTTPPYRNELDSLEARKRVLETELESIQDRIKERRKLPLLDQVKVASPCSASWDDMVGDDRKRFCLSCDKHVFNISALSREDAEQFLAEQSGARGEGGEVCVRFYQRADGTIMTSDCAVGVTRKRRKKLALTVAGAGALAIGAATAIFHQREQQVMGKMEYVPRPPPPPMTTDGPTTSTNPTTHPEGQWIGGAMSVHPTPPPETVRPVPVPKKVLPRR